MDQSRARAWRHHRCDISRFGSTRRTRRGSTALRLIIEPSWLRLGPGPGLTVIRFGRVSGRRQKPERKPRRGDEALGQRHRRHKYPHRFETKHRLSRAIRITGRRPQSETRWPGRQTPRWAFSGDVRRRLWRCRLQVWRPRMERRKGVATAVFPSGPERTVYNNAVLDRGLGASKRRAGLDAMEVAYASTGWIISRRWCTRATCARRASCASYASAGCHGDCFAVCVGPRR